LLLLGSFSSWKWAFLVRRTRRKLGQHKRELGLPRKLGKYLKWHFRIVLIFRKPTSRILRGANNHAEDIKYRYKALRLAFGSSSGYIILCTPMHPEVLEISFFCKLRLGLILKRMPLFHKIYIMNQYLTDSYSLLRLLLQYWPGN
jgi:hypothetical protein